MAVKISFTFSAVLAEVSKKRSPASRAYASASAVFTALREFGPSVAKSNLFPAKAMTMFSFACLCNSFTQAFALSRDAYARVRITIRGVRSVVEGHKQMQLCHIPRQRN